jgi:hypothetical protein
VVIAIVALGLLIVVSSRVAGHLSRQLSRPIHELVGWTDRLGRGEELPEGPPRKGAPEFAVLRSRMRAVARELRDARARNRSGTTPRIPRIGETSGPRAEEPSHSHSIRGRSASSGGPAHAR